MKEAFPENKPQAAEPAEDKSETAEGNFLSKPISRRKFLGGLLAGGALLAAKKSGAEELFKLLGSSSERFREVKEVTLLDLRYRQEEIEAQIGVEGFTELIATMEGLDMSKILDAVQDVAGDDSKEFRSRLERRPIRNLLVLTEGDEKSREERRSPAQKGIKAAGETSRATIAISLASCLDENKKFDPAVFQRIFIHENNHVLTMDGDSGNVDWIPRVGQRAPLDLYEGMTEMQAILVAEKLKIKPTNFYGYAGGNTLAAYYLDRALDPKAVAASYFSGNLHGLEGELERVFGTGTWDELFFEKNRHWILNEATPGVGALNDLDLIFRLLEMSEEKGLDYQKVLEQRKEYGISEEVELIPDEKTKKLASLISFKEDQEGGATARGLAVDVDRPSPYFPPFRFFLNPVKLTRNHLDKSGLFIGREPSKMDMDNLTFTLKRNKDEADKYLAENSGREDKKSIAEKIRNSFVSGFSLDTFICLPELQEALKSFKNLEGRPAKDQKKKEIIILVKRVLKESLDKLAAEKKEKGL